ncbi:MAG: APC family permease, partial [Polaromonas sp.]|nr:APC family permease [Polaromonas sp.]
LVFMAVVAAVNFRGVGESVKANVVLTCVELTGLLIIICIGFWAIGTGQGDVGRAMEFKAPAEGGGAFWSVIAGTTLAFFAMVGFEDSVNMAEECKEPSRIFPKVLLAGLFITGLIYVLVSVSAITLVPPEQLGEGETPLLQVVKAGAPGFPVELFGFITMFAVANSALINMLMASRLVYGMSREGVLPPVLGKVHAARRTPYVAIAFTTLLAFGLITFVGEVPALGGTTALLLLAVFTMVNICVLVLRRDKVAHKHFRTPTLLPVLGAACCAFLVGPWTGRASVQYTIAAVLLGIGVVLWGVTVLVHRHTLRGAKSPASAG